MPPAITAVLDFLFAGHATAPEPPADAVADGSQHDPDVTEPEGGPVK